MNKQDDELERVPHIVRIIMKTFYDNEVERLPNLNILLNIEEGENNG